MPWLSPPQERHTGRRFRLSAFVMRTQLMAAPNRPEGDYDQRHNRGQAPNQRPVHRFAPTQTTQHNVVQQPANTKRHWHQCTAAA
jgi:hypothetical protein